MSKVFIVIVNYRTPALTVECLRSLAGEVGAVAGVRVVVVDNASGDGSAGRIGEAIEREGWGGWASVLANGRNAGFAGGNNAGIGRVREGEPAAYVLLLNPDTVVRAGALGAMVEFMEGHPEVGVVGSGLEDGDGGRQVSAHRFPHPLGELDRGARLGVLSRVLRRYGSCMEVGERPHACDWVSGASMMVRREVFEEVGLLDEGYFLYYDEVDFCARARGAGWEVWCVPGARVVHLEGQATGIRNGRRRRAKYWYDSRRRFFVKKYGILGLIAADGLWAAGRMMYVMRRGLGLAKANGEDPKWFMADLLWGDIRAMLAGELWGIPRIEGRR